MLESTPWPLPQFDLSAVGMATQDEIAAPVADLIDRPRVMGENDSWDIWLDASNCLGKVGFTAPEVADAGHRQEGSPVLQQTMLVLQDIDPLAGEGGFNSLGEARETGFAAVNPDRVIVISQDSEDPQGSPEPADELGDRLDIVKTSMNEVAGEGDEVGGKLLRFIDRLPNVRGGDGPAKVEIAQLGDRESIEHGIEIRDADLDLIGFQPKRFDHSGIA